MSLTAQDKELIKLQAREIAFEVCKEVFSEHIKTCPHGKAILISKWLLVGITIGSAGGGISGGFALAKIIAGI